MHACRLLFQSATGQTDGIALITLMLSITLDEHDTEILPQYAKPYYNAHGTWHKARCQISYCWYFHPPAAGWLCRNIQMKVRRIPNCKRALRKAKKKPRMERTIRGLFKSASERFISGTFLKRVSYGFSSQVCLLWQACSD